MNEAYYGVEPYSGKIIKHFGILGMEWGKRRWQYPDGRFNEAGKERYFGQVSNKQESLKKDIKLSHLNENQRKMLENDFADNFIKTHKKAYENGLMVAKRIDELYSNDKDKQLLDKIVKKLYKKTKANEYMDYDQYYFGMVYDDLNQGKDTIETEFLKTNEGKKYRKYYKNYEKTLNTYMKNNTPSQKITKYGMTYTDTLDVEGAIWDKDEVLYNLYNLKDI